MLTDKEKLCNYETLKHIKLVSSKLNKFASELILRGMEHDQSKLEEPEVSYFSEFTDRLAGTTYNSPEYKELKATSLKPALDHHYANNRHHPQFHKNGINDMNLVDIVEMFCDWWAAGKRHNDGNLRHSIDQNKKDYNMSDQLINIFENTIDFIEDS